MNANLDLKSSVLLRVSPCLLFLHVLQSRGKSHWYSNFSSIPKGFFELLVLRGQWNRFLVISCIIELWFFIGPFMPSPSAWHSFPFSSRALAINWSVLDVRCFLVNLLPDHMYPSGSFLINRVNCVKTCARLTQISWSINIPIVNDAAFLQNIQVCMGSSRRRQRTSVEQGMILLSASKVWLCGSTWWRYMKLPDMDQKSLIASPASGNQSWGGGRDPSDSPRKYLRLSLLELVIRIKVGVLSSWSPPINLIRPSAIGKNKLSYSLGNIISFALSLFDQISDAPIVSNSSRSAISTSPFQSPPAYRAYPRNNPGKTFFPNWWDSWLVLRIYRVILNQWTKWNNRSFNGCPKRLSWGIFPSDKRSWTFRR